MTRDSRETYDGRPAGLPDGPQPLRNRNITLNGLEQQANGRSGAAEAAPSEISPTSLAAVAAFQSFGRRRGMSNDDLMDEYEEQRRREIEVQKARQMRIREKVPGRRATGKAKAGDIDGKYGPISPSLYFAHETSRGAPYT